MGILVLAVVALVVTTLLLAHQQQQTQRALAEARRNFQQYRAQLALTENNLALLQDQNGDFRQAEASLQNAMRLQRGILEEDPDDEQTLRHLAGTLNNLGFLYGRTKLAEAVRCYEEALRIRQRLVDVAPANVKYQSDLALAHGNLGSVKLKQGEPELAADSFRKSIDVLERLRESAGDLECGCDLAVGYNNLGMTQHRLGKLAEAESSFRQALRSMDSQIDRADRTPNDLSSLGGIHNNLGMVLEKQERFAEAAESYGQAIRFQQMACTRAPEVARFRDFLGKHYHNDGRVLRRIGRYQEAAEAALARKEIWRGSPRHVWSVGEELALITRDVRALHPTDTSAQTEADRLVKQTIAVLQEAVDLGLDPATEIPNSEALRALRDDPEMQAWLADFGQADGSVGRPATTTSEQQRRPTPE
jgi:tetratricopeptide (TPR) repeat protein